MLKNTLGDLNPETKNIIQWVNSFNYEEELNKINIFTVTPKQENIKVVQKINFSINDDSEEIFNIVELKPPHQEKNIKCVEVAPTKNNNKLFLNFVSKQDHLKKFNSNEKHDYFYIARDLKEYINEKGETIKPKQFTEINKKNINLFIEQYLNKNNNLYEIITEDNNIKFYIDIDKEFKNNTIEDQQYLLNKVIEFIYSKFKQLLNIEVDKKDIIILNSSTVEKISFHLIYNNIIFENMEVLILFMKIYIKELLLNDVYYYEIFNKTTIDFSIYKKNQQFRLINQSKLNKKGILKGNENINIFDTFINVHSTTNNKQHIIKKCNLSHLKNINIKPVTKEDKKKLKEVKRKNHNKYENHEKVNLMTVKNLTYDDLLKFKGDEIYKRFLYLIKQPATWEEYFLIACALSKLGASIEDFKEWAALHPEYNKDDNIIVSYETKFKKYDKPNFYNINHLKKLARESEPNFFKESAEDLNNILYDLNIDETYNIINESTKYINSDRNIIIKDTDNKNKSFYKDGIYNVYDKIIFLLADLGKGKTTFIKNDVLLKLPHEEIKKLLLEEDIIKHNKKLIDEWNEYNNDYSNDYFNEQDPEKKAEKQKKYNQKKKEFKQSIIKKEIKTTNDKILYLSGRCSFANFIQGDFEILGLKNYLDCKDKEIHEDRIIISLESLHKLKNLDYDYVIIDECETIFKNLDGETMKGKTLNNFNILKDILNKCKNKIICADAYLNNRTIDFFNKNYKEETKTIIINDIPTNSRKAFLLHEEQYYYYMKKALENNENIYSVFGSEKKMRKTINKLLEDKILEEHEILYYCSSCDDKNKNLLLDVNNNWKKYKAVFTTATITIGVSFKELHFNKTFIIGYPSCTARDLFQSHQRVRNLRDNIIYFALPKKSSYNYIYGLCHYFLQVYFNFENEININYEIQYNLLQKIKEIINTNTNLYYEKYKKENIKKVEEYEYF